MKNIRRFLAILMALTMVLSTSALAAELTAPGELPLSQETIHFTVGVPQMLSLIHI